MSTDRIELLRKFVEEEPNDPFNVYALALELAAQKSDEAGDLFETLLSRHSSYLPTYYQAAHYFFVKEERQKSIEILKQGISLAKSSNDFKTLGELNSLLLELED